MTSPSFAEHQHGGFSVCVIPCLQDNYVYLVSAEGSQQALAVDVGEAQPLLSVLAEKGWHLAGVLLTHGDGDHVAGLGQLLGQAQVGGAEVEVFGPQGAPIAGMTRGLSDEARFQAGGLEVRAMSTPGHSREHMTYVVQDAAFTGDALFGGGCGRIFGGTHQQMYHSLQKIASLSPSTRLYVGHEYTLSNLRFALSVEGDNPQLAERLQQTQQLLAGGGWSSPSQVALELATNPFLRCGEESIKRAVAHQAKGDDAEAVFRALRQAKDVF